MQFFTVSSKWTLFGTHFGRTIASCEGGMRSLYIEICGVKFKVNARTPKAMDKITGGGFVGQISTRTLDIDIDCSQHPDLVMLTFFHEFWHLPEKLLSDFPELTEDQIDFLSLMTVALFEQYDGIRSHLRQGCARIQKPK